MKSDTDIIPVFQDVGKKAAAPKGPYSSLVERFRKSGAFVASAKTTQFVRFGGKGGAENVLFVGMGAAEELTAETVRQAGAVAWGRLVAERAADASVQFDLLTAARGLKSELTPAVLARAFAEGLGMASYRYTATKKAPEKSDAGPAKVTFVSKGAKKDVEDAVRIAAAAVEAVNLARDWSNLPANIGHPEYYANEARKLAQKNGLKCRVLTEAEAKREKMNLFLAVGKGSENEGRIVVLEYTPKGAARTKPKTVALVGKGLTFDTGGISIKPAGGMEEMKHDMSGAATMMGAILLASRMKVRNRVIAILAFTENMPSGAATRPGDVVTARSGKTVEIINTDAEGRLVLADALDFAQDYKPDVVIDAATLTGAVVIALGKYACAVLGNDASLVDSLKRAADVNGERMWELPLYDEYLNDIKGDYADIKNVGNGRMAGTITAAMFLKQFIRPGTKWAHLDIACTGWDAGYLPYCPKKGGSGLHVRALAQFAQDF